MQNKDGNNSVNLNNSGLSDASQVNQTVFPSKWANSGQKHSHGYKQNN